MTHTPREATPIAATAPTKPWYRQLYIQVLAAIVIGIVLGWQWPDPATSMEPIGTTFIAAMKMLIGPIVFLTIISGIAGGGRPEEGGPHRPQGTDLLPDRHNSRAGHRTCRDQPLPAG
ncbi:cation:dicarboxylate symporter family transporter [Streptomyces sp. NPDC059916]|uniref:cation:dicarboxylate symporter family transporter n=1 Tax=Streptomyces sp. NPDC059916 TaxID=3347001 RepID=UPI003691BD4A